MIGGIVAAICCATPIPALALVAIGLSAWAAKADYVLIPVILLCLGLVAVALYRRHASRRPAREQGTRL